MYVILSIFLGLLSWAIPVIQICSSEKSHRNWKYMPLLSMALCSASIYIQVLLMKSYGDEWTLIVDALGALKTVVPILVAVAIVLNLIAIKKTEAVTK